MRHLAAVQVPGRAAALAPGTDSTSVSLERAPHGAGPGAGVRDIWVARPSRSGVVGAGTVHCPWRRSTPWPSPNGCWPLRLVPRPPPSCPSDLRRCPRSAVFSQDRGVEVMAKRSRRHTYNPLTGQRMCLCQNGPVGQLFERREGRGGANSCEKRSVGASSGTGRMARRPARRGGSRKTKRPTESGWPVFMVARDGVEPPTRGFSVPCSTN